MKGTIRVLPLEVTSEMPGNEKAVCFSECTCEGSDVAVASEATGSQPGCLSLLLSQPGCWQESGLPVRFLLGSLRLLVSLNWGRLLSWLLWRHFYRFISGPSQSFCSAGLSLSLPRSYLSSVRLTFSNPARGLFPVLAQSRAAPLLRLPQQSAFPSRPLRVRRPGSCP